MWAYALFGPIAGWLGDRLSRKWLILPGLIFWLFVTTATILAHRFWQFAILRGLNGIAEAIYFPAAMSLISSYHGAATLSRAMSLHQSAVYVGTIGGGVVASWLGEHFGWRSNFICFGTFGFLLSAILIFFLREPASDLSCNHNPNTSHAKNPDLSLNKMVAQVLGAPLVLRLIVAFIGANFVAMVFMVAARLPLWQVQTYPRHGRHERNPLPSTGRDRRSTRRGLHRRLSHTPRPSCHCFWLAALQHGNLPLGNLRYLRHRRRNPSLEHTPHQAERRIEHTGATDKLV